MTLPQFAKMLDTSGKPENIGNHFESCVAVYRILNQYFSQDEIEIAIESMEASKEIFKIKIIPVKNIEDLLKLYENIQLELFSTQVHISSKITKKKELIIKTIKK